MRGDLRVLAEAALPVSLTVPAPMRPYAAFLDAVTPEVVLDLLARAEKAELAASDLNPFEWDRWAIGSAVWECEGNYLDNIIAWARFCWWIANQQLPWGES